MINTGPLSGKDEAAYNKPDRFSFRALSLRNRLLLTFILLASLPVFITGILSTYISSQGTRAEVFNQLAAIAQLKEDGVRSWLSSLQINLDLVLQDKSTLEDTRMALQNPEESELAKVELRNKFNDLNESTGYFQELFVMDDHGTIILSTNTSQEGKTSEVQSFYLEGLK
jgi:methyl-accepting chemotaxis protein